MKTSWALNFFPAVLICRIYGSCYSGRECFPYFNRKSNTLLKRGFSWNAVWICAVVLFLTNLYNLREAEMQKCTWWRNFGLWSCQKLICLWRWVNIKFLFFVLPPSVSAGLVWNGNLERGTKFKVQRIGANWRGGWRGVYHFQGNIWIIFWQIL